MTLRPVHADQLDQSGSAGSHIQHRDEPVGVYFFLHGNISFISLEAHFLPSSPHSLTEAPPSLHPPQRCTLFRRRQLQCLAGPGKHDAATWSRRIFGAQSPQKPSAAEKTQAAAGARRLFSHFATQHMSSHASTLPLPSPPAASRVRPPLPRVRPPAAVIVSARRWQSPAVCSPADQ